MMWLTILGFAVSSSIDNLGVGISYGIRGMRIGLLANLLIAGICFLFSEAGILFGRWLSMILPGIFPILVGAFLLVIIGIRIILLAMPRKNGEVQDTTAPPKPKDVKLGEAVLLGIALSANALTNGLGAGLLGFSPLAISVSAAIGSFLTVWAGVALGGKVANIRIGKFTLGQFGTLISGVLLLVIASEVFF